MNLFIFEGSIGVPYDTILYAHPFIQVTSRLHIRTFKEKIIGDKAFPAEIRAYRKGIVFLEEINGGGDMLFFEEQRTEISGSCF